MVGESSAGEIRVLHVDDEPEVTELTREFLRRESDRLTVVTATSAREALDQFDGETFDCVVSDYDMPEMDGLELLAAVRDRRPAVPFLIFTGKGDEEVASEAISAGVTDYMRKGRGREQYTMLANRIENAVRRRRAERRLERRNRRFEKLVESSNDVITVLGPDGRFSYVSPASKPVLGYDPDSLLGEVGFDYIHEADREEAMAEYGEMVEDPSYEPSVEFRFRHADGSWIVLEARGRNLLDDPAVEGVVVYTRDVTERREREAELREEKAFNEAALQTVVDFYWVIDMDGNVTRWSDADGEVTGYTEAEATGRHAAEFFPDSEIGPVMGAITEMRESGTAELDTEFLTADGRRVPYRFSGTALTDDDGETVRMCGFGRDISAQRERERTLERQNERLERLTGVLSHDLRNPLNVAMGKTDLVRQECDSDHLAGIDRAHERMAELVDDVLALAREGASVEETERVDIASVVRDCWEVVATDAATLRVDDEFRVAADESRLRQLLENVFRNAVEHGSAGGPTWSDDAAEHGLTGDPGGADGGDETVEVRVGRLDGGRGFYVEDDGRGVPTDDADRVFEPGFSTAEEGTGLGLSIVEEIAQAHGWTPRVAEGTDGGFRLEFLGVDSV